MHTLTVNVIWATGLRRETAKLAIGRVLLFLLKKVPEVNADEFIDQMSPIRLVVDDLKDDGLIEELTELGLTMTQIVALFDQICARAKTLAPKDAAKIREKLNEVRGGAPVEPHEIECPKEELRFSQSFCDPDGRQA